MQEVEGLRKSLILEVEHEVDLALAVEFGAFRAVPMGPTEPQAVQHLGERTDPVGVIHELDELDAVDGGQRRGLRRPPDLLVEPQEGAHTVGGNPAGRRGTEIVAEDLVADRPQVADLMDFPQHSPLRSTFSALPKGIQPDTADEYGLRDSLGLR